MKKGSLFLPEGTVKPPAYLFSKLGRYVGISTGSGNIYALSKDTFTALTSWNKDISRLEIRPTAAGLRQLSEKHGVPADITALFPLSKDDYGYENNSKPHFTDITLNITSSCNLRCRYCWNDRGHYSNDKFRESAGSRNCQERNRDEMTPETARKAVDLLLSLKGEEKDLVVDFYGGEPLLNLETLLAAVDYCRKNQKRWKVNFHFLLATNGTLLVPRVARELITQSVQIAVSVDGGKNIHDRNRPFANGKGSFSTISDNLKRLSPEIMKRLVGRATVTPLHAQMTGIFNDLRKMGFERMELFESEDACHRVNKQREAVFFKTKAQYEQLCREYERLALKYIAETVSGRLDYKKTFFNRFFKLMQRLYYNHRVTGGCPAAQGQLAVSADGGIYPCTSFLGIKEFELGNLYRGGLDEKKHAKFLTQVKKRFTNCGSCALFSLCRTTGSCLNINHYFNGDVSQPHEKSCLLFREKIELAAAALVILNEKMPKKLEELFGFDPVGRRGNKLY